MSIGQSDDPASDEKSPHFFFTNALRYLELIEMMGQLLGNPLLAKEAQAVLSDLQLGTVRELRALFNDMMKRRAEELAGQQTESQQPPQ